MVWQYRVPYAATNTARAGKILVHCVFWSELSRSALVSDASYAARLASGCPN